MEKFEAPKPQSSPQQLIHNDPGFFERQSEENRLMALAIQASVDEEFCSLRKRQQQLLQKERERKERFILRIETMAQQDK
jgi:TFIIF-interacting CTD phosphatase-like protein